MDDLQQQLETARQDEALWDASHMNHAAAVNRINDLISQIDGNEQPSERVMPEIEHNASFGEERLDANTADFLTAPAHPEDISFAQVQLPEGFEEDTAEIEQCREWLYSAEIAQPQIDGLIKLYCDALTWDEDRIALEGRQARETLTQKYGDKVDDALHIAASAAHSVGGEQLLDYLDATGLGNRYEVIQTFIDIAERKGVRVNG